MALAAFERVQGPAADWLTIFGPAPLLNYVAHLYLIHALAVVYAAIALGDSAWLFAGLSIAQAALLRAPVAWPLCGVA